MVVRCGEIIPIPITYDLMATGSPADAKQNRTAGIQVGIHHAVQSGPNCGIVVPSIDGIGVSIGVSESDFRIIGARGRAIGSVVRVD